MDAFPPEDFEPPPSVEVKINIAGFIVTGFKEVSVTIAGEEIPEENGEPVEEIEAEPVEIEAPVEEE